jgi:transposase InsO family protein
MAERTAWRICRDGGWWSVFGRKRRGKATRPGTPVREPAVCALDHALTRRGTVTDCAFHPDRGSHCRSRKLRHVLRRHGSAGSNGTGRRRRRHRRNGEILPSAAEERAEPHRLWSTRQELRTAIGTWIERTYHRRRRKARLGGLTPIEYETIISAAVPYAA